MWFSEGAGVVGPALSSGAGGCGRYSISAFFSSPFFGSAQKPPDHCQPSAAFRHEPCTHVRPGGMLRQKPLIQRKSFFSSS